MSGGYMSSRVYVLGGTCLGVKCSGGTCPWSKCLGGKCLGEGGGACPEQDIITLNNIQGLFQGFITLIINIEGKYVFFVHFWHQTFIALVLDISILTLDMSVNNTSNSSIFHILLFHNSELG